MINLSKSDIKRIEKIKVFLKNANLQLKSKSVEEIENIFKTQEKIINAITDLETKNYLLEQFNILKNSVINSTNKFHNIIEKLTDCENILKGKNKDDIIQFFNEIDNDISIIPDMRMRHLILNQSNYWKTRRLDDYYLENTKDMFIKLEIDIKIAGNTIKDIEEFFIKINNDINKISDKQIITGLLSISNILRNDSIKMLEPK